MEILGKDDLDKADSMPDLPKPVDVATGVEMTDDMFDEMLRQLENPVQAQKAMAVRIKSFLDVHIDKELKEKGFLTEYTRRWVKQYNDMLETIQKSLFGDKTVNLHLVKVSHSHIATKMREYKKEGADGNNC